MMNQGTPYVEIYPSLARYRSSEHPTESFYDYRDGLGEMSQQTQKIVMGLPSIIGGVLTAPTVTTVAGITTAGPAIAASWGALAVPIIGAAVVGVTIALALIFGRKGPKQKVATTHIVDQVEPLLQQNLKGYLEGPRTVSSREQALANFDAGWQFVVEHCDIPVMGDPGKECVNDRKAGACEYREAGECWNWFIGYRDPIANDVPNPDPTMTEEISSTFDSLFGSIGGTPGQTPWGLIGAGALLLAAMVIE